MEKGWRDDGERIEAFKTDPEIRDLENGMSQMNFSHWP
jgi:hypothetical protein